MLFFSYATLSIQDLSITVGFLGPWDPWHYATKPPLWGQRRQSRRCRQGDPTNLKLRGSLDALPGKRHEVLRPIWRNSTKSSPSGCRTRQHFLPRACETCWGQRSATAMITSVRLYATDHVSPEGGERKIQIRSRSSKAPAASLFLGNSPSGCITSRGTAAPNKAKYLRWAQWGMRKYAYKFTMM